jgi:tetratricopeptide (TPR) repeat protein
VKEFLTSGQKFRGSGLRAEGICHGNLSSQATKIIGLLIGMVNFFACDSYQVAGLAQSGRQALLKKDFETALGHFEEVARRDPNYVYTSALFHEGIWTYVGRCQYVTGRLPQARQSLDLALTKDKADLLARLYLGMTLLRSGDDNGGRAELQSATKELYDWIEYTVNTRPHEAHWDPNKQIRGELKKTLTLVKESELNRSQVLLNAEWLGAEIEEEIERVRRDESRRE